MNMINNQCGMSEEELLHLVESYLKAGASWQSICDRVYIPLSELLTRPAIMALYQEK